MEKHTNQMDLDEWEVLSDDGFFELHHHVNDNHRNKKVLTIDSGFDDYFICSSPKKSVVIKDMNKNQLVPVNIQLEQKKEKKKKPEEEQIIVKEMIKVPIVEIKTPKLVLVGEDQDTISQVFFKKMKENEFVDMKLDSPKSVSRGIKAPPAIESGAIQFEDKEEIVENKKIDDQEAVKKKLDSKDQKNLEKSNYGGGLQIWKWRITGTGALCSLGITAATICILIIGSRKKQKHHQQNQKYRIQIYAEDKRIKQVVHHASKLNHAIAAARGVPLTRAHFTIGGYFDGL
ncbi:hypothetical protein MKW98_032545 [Papaver atlanticum]|uniref:DUF6821 domain-containing protein n=1 Tax=Papaver atlanticum TaxID=357466 RepID=A0AAD4SVW3_9MAGN|nr:hypothetical protein MKW98_032545 [Papaver atlanticum]